MAALDFPNAPINGTQYTAPNGAVYTYDGAAWTVSGVISTGTTAGGDLSGTYPTPAVAKVNGAPLGTTTPLARGDLLVANATPALARLALGANLTLLQSNGSDAVWTTPLWSVSGATLTPTDATKAVAVPGPTTGTDQAAVVLGAATQKTRLTSAALVGTLSENYRYNGTTWSREDGTTGAWRLGLGTGGNTVLVFESAAGVATTVLTINGGTTPPGDIAITGNNATKATGTVWVNPSDRRIKKNIAPYVRGLAAILALKPSTFEFNGLAGSVDGSPGLGLIADDVEPIMPEMVSRTPIKLRDDDAAPVDLLRLDTSALVLALVNAVQELAARVVALEAARA